jgi:hypothetical protein
LARELQRIKPAWVLAMILMTASHCRLQQTGERQPAQSVVIECLLIATVAI